MQTWLFFQAAYFGRIDVSVPKVVLPADQPKRPWRFLSLSCDEAIGSVWAATKQASRQLWLLSGIDSTTPDQGGRAKLYADIAHPINSACREMIQQRVIQAFEEERARSKLPGYVPTYEDLDDDSTWTPPASAETPKIQAAETPRGPHHPPTAPQRHHSPRRNAGERQLWGGHLRVGWCQRRKTHQPMP